MSQIIYHVFNKNDSENKNQETEVVMPSEIKIFNHIGKSGEKFVCMQFESIFQPRKAVCSASQKLNTKTNIDVLREIMERMCCEK